MGKEKTKEAILSNLVIEQKSNSKLNAQVIMSNIYKTKEDAESFSSKLDKLDDIQKQISEVDTLSEISHTLTHDDNDEILPTEAGVFEVKEHAKRHTATNCTSYKEMSMDNDIKNTSTNESVVKAIVHAQDAIAKTQKEHFENLFTSLEAN